MVILRKFRFYFIFYIIVILLTFGLSLALLRCGVIRLFITMFYPCESDLNKQNRFDPSNISNYDH